MTTNSTDADKVVVVTGGASGIGAACVGYFAERGWRVLVNYFQDSERERAVALADSGRGIAVRGDVRSDEDCRRLASEAKAAFGRIDALVCSAGSTRLVPHAALDALNLEDFERTAAVNTAGPFLTARACAELLRASGNGSVVIVSSYGGLYGTGSSIAYAASKGATNTLTMSLARVLAPHVRVNAVCPALVEEGFVQRLDPDIFAARVEQQLAHSPLKRIGRPTDVAADVYWLSTGASLVTGSLISLDCGLHLNGG